MALLDSSTPPSGQPFSVSGRTILVTGGNGFIGSSVVRLLLSCGATVRCLVRPQSNLDRLRSLAFQQTNGDVRDPSSLLKALAGCDGAIHLAGLSAWDQIDSPEMKRVTEDGTRNLLDAALAQAVGKVVFVSSAAAINGSDRPKTFDEHSTFELSHSRLSYARHKHEAERICGEYVARGLPVVIVNPTEVYGPNDTALITAGNLVDFAKSSPVLICSGGTSVAYVEDVALGIVRAMERGAAGERYILGGENLHIRELAALTLELLGKKAPIVTLPNFVIRPLARLALLLKLPVPFNPRVIPYATRYWFMDNRKAVNELGVTFRTARECLRPTIQWLREQGLIP